MCFLSSKTKLSFSLPCFNAMCVRTSINYTYQLNWSILEIVFVVEIEMFLCIETLTKAFCTFPSLACGNIWISKQLPHILK